MHSTNPPELLIVMPVYNEQASARKVVMEWFQEIENWTEDFVFLAIDDGSTDETPRVLARLRDQLGERFEIERQDNQGHGQSCLHGYRQAIARNAGFVFQIDSDGQCDPQYFFRFWRQRHQYEAIYGNRVWRQDGWRRILASSVLKWTLFAVAGVWCIDANVPYRLMQTRAIEAAVNRIPRKFFLANVALAVLLQRDPKIRHGAIQIGFRERYGGEPSVQLGRFGEKAMELVRQLRELK